MMKLLMAAMPADMSSARKLEAQTGFPLAEIAVRKFPDGESLVRAEGAAETVIVYCTLDHPNEKLVELGLAAAALRQIGARRLVLVAPYLCYMRQDKAFHDGEAIAQRFVGALLARWFDRIVTVEPHLHRIRALSEVTPGAEADALSSAGLLAQLIRQDAGGAEALLVGPDAESARWTSSVAKLAGAPYITLEKVRSGDRAVAVATGDDAKIAGRRVCLVDDVASTGATLAAAAQLLKGRGAARVEAVVTHALFSESDHAEMRAAGVDKVRSTDSVAHFTNAIEVAPLLAAALEKERSG